MVKGLSAEEEHLAIWLSWWYQQCNTFTLKSPTLSTRVCLLPTAMIDPCSECWFASSPSCVYVVVGGVVVVVGGVVVVVGGVVCGGGRGGCGGGRGGCGGGRGGCGGGRGGCGGGRGGCGWWEGVGCGGRGSGRGHSGRGRSGRGGRGGRGGCNAPPLQPTLLPLEPTFLPARLALFTGCLPRSGSFHAPFHSTPAWTPSQLRHSVFTVSKKTVSLKIVFVSNQSICVSYLHIVI